VSMEVTQYDVALLEKQAAGVFLTFHPFADHAMYSDSRYMQLEQLEQSVSARPASWQDRSLPSMGLAGLLTSVIVRTANTSKKTYAKARLEDPERSISLLIWPNTYEQAKAYIVENQPVIVWGKMQLPEVADEGADAWDGAEIVVDKIEPY